MAHRPVRDREKPDECRICGKAVVGESDTLRHAGETIAIIVPAAVDLPGFTAAIDAGKTRAHLVPDDASLEDHVRAVVEGVYLAGLLRRRPGSRKDDALKRPTDVGDDWAARAAGDYAR